ncbi:MAG: hypothetical protein NZM29_04650 [Nitrospira sp.]|nr:hypothetical protein [Nitrospira sp.]
MKSRKGTWILGLVEVAAILTMVVTPGLADQGHRQMGHGGHDQEERADHSGHYIKHLLKHAKEFGLTADQVAKLKALQLDFKRTEARLEADRKIAKLELDALLDDEKTDLAEIHTKIEQLKRSEGALLFSAIKSQRGAEALLTPEQREKDRAHREQMKSEGRGQRGGGMGGGMMGSMGERGRGGMGGSMSGAGHGGRGSHGGGQLGGGHRSGMSGMDHGSHKGAEGGSEEGQADGDQEGEAMGGGQHQH